MEFWALENAPDDMVIMFGIAMLFFFIVGSVMAISDFFKKRKR